MSEKIPLSDLIVELRRELLDAQRRGQQEGLKFLVEDVELELQLAASDSTEAGAGVKFWILSGEAKGKVSSQSLQKVTLKLKPLNRAVDGGAFEVGGEDTLSFNEEDRMPAP